MVTGLPRYTIVGVPMLGDHGIVGPFEKLLGNHFDFPEQVANLAEPFN